MASVFEYHEFMLGNELMTPEGFLAALFQVFSISTRLQDLDVHARVINNSEAKFCQIQQELYQEGIDDEDIHLLEPD